MTLILLSISLSTIFLSSFFFLLITSKSPFAKILFLSWDSRGAVHDIMQLKVTWDFSTTVVFLRATMITGASACFKVNC